MEKLDIERIKSQLCISEEDFAKKMGISMEELRSYCDGTAKPSLELLMKMTMITRIFPDQLFTGTRPTVDPIEPQDTYKPSEITKNSLVEYIEQGIAAFKEETLQEEIQKIQKCVNVIRKPRISFAGQSDTGKSTLINALLGSEKMPAKWTPTTSIVVYIKHIDDKPSFIKENVWILGKKSDELWDDFRLNDEKYCKEFFIAGGDYSLLEQYGTHQKEKENAQRASAAVAFIDSPLLKNCDILDLPGFAATAEDDALHRFNTQQNVTDILLYLSRSNGFLQDRDLDYLRKCIRSLRPVEKRGINDLEKLENLFIIASQAGAVNNGNVTELKEILDGRCKALCEGYALAVSSSKNKSDSLLPFQSKQTSFENRSKLLLPFRIEQIDSNIKNESLLPFRTEQTGYDYFEEDFRKRFFTYEKDIPSLCERFSSKITSISEKLPKAIYKDFCRELKKTVAESSDIIQKRVDEWNAMLNDKTRYMDLAREIKQKEPARKIERAAEMDKMVAFIQNLEASSKQDIQSMYTETMETEHLVGLMEERGVKNKRSDKEDFASAINELISSQVQSILAEKSKEYTASIDKYIEGYTASFEKYSAGKDVNIQFDVLNSFALGLASLGVLGASAVWLATSFTAFSVSMLGILAGWGSVLAVGGVIGIAIAAVITGIISIFKAFTWKQDFAKTIISVYEKEKYIDRVFNEVEKYWDDTVSSFKKGSEKVEEDWQKRLEEYESIADEKNIPALEAKIVEAKRGLDFFTKMPLPDAG